MSWWLRARVVFVSLAAFACSGDADSTSDAGTETATSEETTAVETGAADPGYAREIRVVSVELNQGVAIEIADEDGPIPANRRRANVISGRDALLRVYHEVDEDTWRERAIEGRLTLHHEDGELEELPPVQVEVLRSTYDFTLDRSFFWGIPADKLRPGTRYELALYELEGAPEDAPTPEPPPRVPLEGIAELGADAFPRALELQVVPIRSPDASCDVSPWPEGQPDEERLANIERLIHDLNPVQTLTVELAPAFLWAEEISSNEQLGAVLDALMLEREARATPDHVYVMGLLDVCAPCPGCNAGLGPVAPSDPEFGYLRTSVTRVDAPSYAAVAAHELGHNQGRVHAPCDDPSGDPGELDADYPYADGSLGAWGFDLSDQELRDPGVFRDYMSYCSPPWASDYTWRETDARIRELTAWSGRSSATPRADTLVVRLTRSPDGAPLVQRPRIVPGPRSLARASARYTASFATDDGSRSAPAMRVEIGDSPDSLLLMSIPSGLEARAVQLRDRGVAIGPPIELADVSRPRPRG